MIFKASINSMTVRQDGCDVQLLLNGRHVTTLTWQAADELARALTIQARKAEEMAKVDDIIEDQAILTRLGVPFGLTSNTHMIKAAANMAAWDSKLRRQIPPSRAGGIASQAVFGTPNIIRHPPPIGGNDDGKT